jgi:hypothetical protein
MYIEPPTPTHVGMLVLITAGNNRATDSCAAQAGRKKGDPDKSGGLNARRTRASPALLKASRETTGASENW